MKVKVEIVSYAVLVLGLTLVGVVVYYFRREHVLHVFQKARERLVWGLPIGSALIIGVNIGFYLLVQRGFWHPDTPLVLPFYSWSYTYPIGVLASPISHANLGHLVSNLTSVVLFAPLAEYIVGHRSESRGGKSVLRAFGFGVLLYLAGVFLTLFSWGAVVGFSGVIFLLLGFITVFYPLYAVALVVLGRVLNVFISAIRSPVVIRSGSEKFVTPWWANIAVETHSLGLLVGLLVGIYLMRKKGIERDGFYVGTAVIVIGMLQGIYAVWFFSSSGSSYVLYQAVGFSLVLVGGILVGTAVKHASEYSGESFELFKSEFLNYSALLLPILVICFVAVPINSAIVVTEPTTNSVDIDGYSVWYTEKAERNDVSWIPFVQNTSFNASGVIVSNPHRGIWNEQVSKEELRSKSEVEFYVGGIRTSTRVVVKRKGVKTPTGNTSYSVIVSSREDNKTIFNSDPAPTGVSFGPWNISVKAVDGEFRGILEKGNTTVSAPIKNTTTQAQGVNFRKREDRIVASYNHNGTLSSAVIARVE